MVSKLVAAALVLSLVLPACLWAGTPRRASVQPLQYLGETFCTVFSINEAEGLWASARHCADAALEIWTYTEQYATIDGVPVSVVYVDSLDDVAVFKSTFKAPALKLAKKAAKVCDPFKPDKCDVVATVGHPYGVAEVVTVGVVGARDVVLIHPTLKIPVKNDILDLTVAGGNSGGPVLNKKGEVVGILWGMFAGSGYSASVPLDSVKRALANYWR